MSAACAPSPFPLPFDPCPFMGTRLFRAPTPPVPGPAWSVSALPAPPSGCAPSAPAPLSPPSQGTFLLSLDWWVPRHRLILKLGAKASDLGPPSSVGTCSPADLRQLDALCVRATPVLGANPPDSAAPVTFNSAETDGDFLSHAPSLPHTSPPRGPTSRPPASSLSSPGESGSGCSRPVAEGPQSFLDGSPSSALPRPVILLPAAGPRD